MNTHLNEYFRPEEGDILSWNTSITKNDENLINENEKGFGAYLKFAGMFLNCSYPNHFLNQKALLDQQKSL